MHLKDSLRSRKIHYKVHVNRRRLIGSLPQEAYNVRHLREGEAAANTERLQDPTGHPKRWELGLVRQTHEPQTVMLLSATRTQA